MSKINEGAGDLASMLTTNRWYYMAYGTASQYLGLRDEANAMFAESLRLAREHSWEVLEHFVLSHWGRSLVEEGHYSRARDCFVQALAIRERLNEPRAASSRRHLAALDKLESVGR